MSDFENLKDEAKKLVINPWPPMELISNDKWRRVWRFTFETVLSFDINLKVLEKEIRSETIETLKQSYDSLSLTDEMFQLAFEKTGERSITATVITGEEGWWDCFFFFATYRMFAGIEKRIGAISKIEEQERQYWRPWR